MELLSPISMRFSSLFRTRDVALYRLRYAKQSFWPHGALNTKGLGGLTHAPRVTSQSIAIMHSTNKVSWIIAMLYNNSSWVIRQSRKGAEKNYFCSEIQIGVRLTLPTCDQSFFIFIYFFFPRLWFCFFLSLLYSLLVQRFLSQARIQLRSSTLIWWYDTALVFLCFIENNVSLFF